VIRTEAIGAAGGASAGNGAARTAGGVIVGGDFVGLGIVRSLGRRGVPACVIDDEQSISRFSRYASVSVRVPDLRDEARTVEALMEVGERHGLSGWVLFPTRDEIVAAISRNADLLAERYRVPLSGWEAIRSASDKRNLYSLGERLGIPVPRTWRALTLDELDALDIEFPVAVKPAVKEHFIYETKAKAWRANSRQELRELYERAAAIIDRDEILLQDLIPGDGRHQYAYCAFYKEGQAIGSMTVRRRRQHPPEFGRASTFVETIDIPTLEEYSTRLLDALDFYGLVEVEFKHDPRDGNFRLLDFNARAWGYHSLGSGAGVDFPYLVFGDQVGLPVDPSRARPGVRWIRFTTDLPTAVVEMKAGRLDLRTYLRTVFGGFDVEAVFSREDLGPGLAELALLPYLMKTRGF
jgi:predicted ATP-grasp superfamily ATP-dependent carboligase